MSRGNEKAKLFQRRHGAGVDLHRVAGAQRRRCQRESEDGGQHQGVVFCTAVSAAARSAASAVLMFASA